jgi:hypothetical protein
MKKGMGYIIAIVVIVIAIVIIFLPKRGETPIIKEGDSKSEPVAAAADQIQEKIIGEWISVDDSNYSVRYEANGKVFERYESTSTSTPLVSSEGRWAVVIDNGELTLATSFDSEVFAYRVIEFTDTSMTLRERNAIRDNHFQRR